LPQQRLPDQEGVITGRGETIDVAVIRSSERKTLRATLGTRGAQAGLPAPHVEIKAGKTFEKTFAGERHFKNIRQLTFGGENAEAYFSPDGTKLIYQATPRGASCDQEYIMNADGSNQHMVSTGKGVTIHTIDCETLENYADTPERWLDVAWSTQGDPDQAHVGRISVTIGNEPGSLGALTTIIGKHGGNITNLKITNRSQDFFEILVDIEVQDVKHLTNIIAALRAAPSINSVDRARG